MKSFCFKVLVFFLFITSNKIGQSQTSPEELKFVRQGVRRLIFDPDQSIPLVTLEPRKLLISPQCIQLIIILKNPLMLLLIKIL